MTQDELKIKLTEYFERERIRRETMTVRDRLFEALIEDGKIVRRQLPIAAIQATADGMVAMMDGDMTEMGYRFGLASACMASIPAVDMAIKQMEEMYHV